MRGNVLKCSECLFPFVADAISLLLWYNGGRQGTVPQRERSAYPPEGDSCAGLSYKVGRQVICA